MPRHSYETDWIVQVKESLETMPSDDQQRWGKPSIYKVPGRSTNLNPKAYQPLAVSFGPYHYGQEHLYPMEEHKHRALLHFLKRSGKPLERFLTTLREVEEDLMASYEALAPKWKEGSSEGTASRFLQLMIPDGCFMLEFLRSAPETLNDYASNDPIFSKRGKLNIMSYIKRDMLMLENQLPMLVLDRLVAVESDGKKDGEFVNKLILKFCRRPCKHIEMMGKCLHVLDVFRKSMLMEPKPELDKIGHNGVLVEEIIGSATPEADKIGHGGDLPTSFDPVKRGGKYYNKEVAKLFKSLAKEVTLEPNSSLDAVHNQVSMYCMKPWSMWRAYLFCTYFRNPWAIPSFIAGLSAFVLTVIQTVYAFLGYKP
ncbi:hypothetical protein NL676_005575 [Syzygium grande]|nr:hypothetical protein NL676_005575 [Syzygium grande]